MSTRPLRNAALLIAFAGTVLIATSALASHYRLIHAAFVTDVEREALERAGIAHTKALLEWTATPTGRARLNAATGLPLERLEVLATQVDLLRVPGFGPTMVVPLQDAGIRTSADLARADSAALLKQLAVVTRGTELHHRLPADDTVRTWIAAARRLRPVLKGLPTPP
jgi:hypothetical protein